MAKYHKYAWVFKVFITFSQVSTKIEVRRQMFVKNPSSYFPHAKEPRNERKLINFSKEFYKALPISAQRADGYVALKERQ